MTTTQPERAVHLNPPQACIIPDFLAISQCDSLQFTIINNQTLSIKTTVTETANPSTVKTPASFPPCA